MLGVKQIFFQGGTAIIFVSHEIFFISKMGEGKSVPLQARGA
jgi:hypothetical protein